jgi:hypothetical protein
MWRYDHVGNIVEFPDGTTTCGNRGGYTHRLFAADKEGGLQAMTWCGRRASEFPGQGPIDCPECLERWPADAEGEAKS